MAPLGGYQLEREGSHAVALDLQLDDELTKRGLVREVIHAVQSARKEAGLAVEDRIALELSGDDAMLVAAREYQQLIADEALATTIEVTDALEGASATTLDGHELLIKLEKA
jgi:isoleucyl-tRNA synthetase